MNHKHLRQFTGLLFITGAIFVNIPYTLLIMNFNYPDILRQPAGVVLTQFQAGGAGLIFTWLAFAWAGLPLFVGMLLYPRVSGGSRSTLVKAATITGIIAFLVQVIGLLRWVFVVPVLAQMYVNPAASVSAGKRPLSSSKPSTSSAAWCWASIWANSFPSPGPCCCAWRRGDTAISPAGWPGSASLAAWFIYWRKRSYWQLSSPAFPSSLRPGW